MPSNSIVDKKQKIYCIEVLDLGKVCTVNADNPVNPVIATDGFI